MKRTDLSQWACPIARSLGCVGEWWSILILRDAMHGLRRFDEFEKSLGIAPSMLARRLADLVEAGMLERVPYCERPPRYEYRLTARGHSFRSVMLALLDWGNRELAGTAPAVQLVERTTGRPVRMALVDADTGAPITAQHHVLAPGAGADARMRAQFAARPGAASGPAAD